MCCRWRTWIRSWISWLLGSCAVLWAAVSSLLSMKSGLLKKCREGAVNGDTRVSDSASIHFSRVKTCNVSGQGLGLSLCIFWGNNSTSNGQSYLYNPGLSRRGYLAPVSCNKINLIIEGLLPWIDPLPQVIDHLN